MLEPRAASLASGSLGRPATGTVAAAEEAHRRHRKALMMEASTIASAIVAGAVLSATIEPRLSSDLVAFLGGMLATQPTGPAIAANLDSTIAHVLPIDVLLAPLVLIYGLRPLPFGRPTVVIVTPAILVGWLLLRAMLATAIGIVAPVLYLVLRVFNLLSSRQRLIDERRDAQRVDVGKADAVAQAAQIVLSSIPPPTTP